MKDFLEGNMIPTRNTLQSTISRYLLRSLSGCVRCAFPPGCSCQKLPEPGVLLLQLSQSSDLLGLEAAVLLPPAVIGRLRHLDEAADLGDGLSPGDQLIGSALLRLGPSG